MGREQRQDGQKSMERANGVDGYETTGRGMKLSCGLI